MATRWTDKGAANGAAKVTVGESSTALEVKSYCTEDLGLTLEGAAGCAAEVAAEEHRLRKKTKKSLFLGAEAPTS